MFKIRGVAFYFVILSLLLVISTIFFGTIYFGNIEATTQNEGFYPSTREYSIVAFAEDTNDPIWKVSYSTIHANYERNNGGSSIVYETDHPNELSEMHAGLPVPVIEYNVQFGDEVPFTLSGSEATVVSQEIYFAVAVVNSDTKEVVEILEERIVQNEEQNSIQRSGSIDFVAPKASSNEFRHQQGYSVFTALKKVNTYDNGSSEISLSYSYIFNYVESQDSFISNSEIRDDSVEYPDFSVITYNNALVRSGLISSAAFMVLSFVAIYKKQQ